MTSFISLDFTTKEFVAMHEYDLPMGVVIALLTLDNISRRVAEAMAKRREKRNHSTTGNPGSHIAMAALTAEVHAVADRVKSIEETNAAQWSHISQIRERCAGLEAKIDGR